MKKLLFLVFATVIGCTTTTPQTTSDMKKNVEILVSESQGGTATAGFTIIKNDQELQKALKIGSNTFIVEGTEPAPKSSLVFPKDKKVVLYNLGMFRSGDHRINDIKKAYVTDDVLFIEVPYIERGEMEIQVISNPYIIFTVPSHYHFTSVQLKYSN